MSVPIAASDRRATNLDHVWKSQQLDQHLAAVQVLFGKSNLEQRRLLRHHDERPIDDTEEIHLRATLDAVLHIAGLLEVGFVSGVLNDPAGRCRELIPLLSLSEVQTYYTQRYPILLPHRLLLRLLEGRTSSSKADRTAWYSSLLALNERFRDEELDVFLTIVDGFEHDGQDFSDLQAAARSGERILKAILTPREDREIIDQALAGLERFIMFSADLHDHLNQARGDHNLHDAAFALYRYWYQARSGELAGVTGDALAALSGTDGEGAAYTAEHLHSINSLFALAGEGHSQAFFPLAATIMPESEVDWMRLLSALESVSAEDPSIATFLDQESGQVIVQGSNEQQLAEIVFALRRAKVAVKVGAPQVAYLESISQLAEIEYSQSTPGRDLAQFGRVKIRFEPGQSGSGFVFGVASISGLPQDGIHAVRSGLEIARQSGLLAGFPVTDFRAVLIDCSLPNESSVDALKIASREAFFELREKGDPILLEPIMRVEVLTPEAYIGDVISDLNSRRAEIRGTDSHGGDAQVVKALAPLSTMLGFKLALGRITRGNGHYVSVFSHYDRVPRSIADEVASIYA